MIPLCTTPLSTRRPLSRTSRPSPTRPPPSSSACSMSPPQPNPNPTPNPVVKTISNRNRNPNPNPSPLTGTTPLMMSTYPSLRGVEGHGGRLLEDGTYGLAEGEACSRQELRLAEVRQLCRRREGEEGVGECGISRQARVGVMGKGVGRGLRGKGGREDGRSIFPGQTGSNLMARRQDGTTRTDSAA